MASVPNPPTRAVPSGALAFPRGTYTKYKRATAYFLTWLLRARHNVAASDDASSIDPNQPLNVYEKVVEAIAKDPQSSLSPVLRQEYPRALQACESAITLRTRVALFFGDAADHAHAHFLDRMKAWCRILTEACLSTIAVPELPVRRDDDGEKVLDCSNYYDVLELPDDYFDNQVGSEDEGERDDERPPTMRTTLSSADRTRLLDETLASDFHAELACMLMELEELSEAVYAAFHDVKLENKSLMEAAVVAKVAIDCAGTVIANFQLLHPSIGDAQDFVKLVEDHMPPDQIRQLVEAVEAAWVPYQADVRYQYVRGTIVVDVVGITRALVEFDTLWQSRQRILFPPGDPIFKDAYDEETTQEWVMPTWSEMSSFVRTCLPRIFLAIASLAKPPADLQFDGLDDWLLGPFAEFVQTGKISILLVFVCTCWARSVAALQGNRDLGRTISSSFTHLWELEEQLLMSMERSPHRNFLYKQNETVQAKLKSFASIEPLLRTSPLLAACVLLDHQLRYVILGSDALFVSLFGAFSHIYSALRDRKLLEEIPFLEEAIRVYEDSIFTPSRAAATHGSFARSFLANYNLIETTVALKYGTATATRPGHTRSVVQRARFVNLSRVFWLVIAKDVSGLPSQPFGSWKSLLAAVSSACREEMFGSRLLSRNTLRLGEDIDELCMILCDQLGQRSHYERTLANSTTPDRQRALESSIIFPLLPILDSLQDHDVAQFASEDFDSTGGVVMVGPVSKCSIKSRVAFCRVAASVIVGHFGVRSRVEKIYHIFPATPAWASTEFGSSRLTNVKENDAQTEEEFTCLMKILQTSRAPLRDDQLADFKRRVIATPGVIAMVSVNPEEELCTLFHLAAAGPAHDLHIVEWFIQMGALEHEPQHCRHPEIAKAPNSPVRLCNFLAVHCAAKRGIASIVRHIIEAGSYRDLNTRTYHTKESLMQLAVQAGSQPLWAWLLLFGADRSGEDSLGRNIWELTSDPAWRECLKTLAEADESSLGRSGVRPTEDEQSVEAQARLATSTLTSRTVGTDATPKRAKKKRSKKKTKSKVQRALQASGAPTGNQDAAEDQRELPPSAVGNRTDERTE